MQNILRRSQVRECTGLSDSSLDREMKAGRFPRPIKLSAAPNCRAVGWPSAGVEAYIEQRIEAGHKEAAEGSAELDPRIAEMHAALRTKRVAAARAAAA